ncbi:MAG: serine hydrolase domain-containing protein, partial [Chlamydiota bacterium]
MENASYFAASTTKLFITTVILQLQAKGLLRLDDCIAKYLDPKLIHQLHFWRGRDYSHEISIRHLLSHTSGLADYFEQAPKGKETLRSQLVKGHDRSWDLQYVLDLAKAKGAQFPPAYKKKALYSDTNFQLLGQLLESILKQELASIFAERIFAPLGLRQTYLYTDPNDTTPVPLHYKRRPLHIPEAMTSFGSDGGIVSTSGDMMQFIQAFFEGRLFPSAYLTKIQDWRNIFFPLQYGVGLSRFRLPR